MLSNTYYELFYHSVWLHTGTGYPLRNPIHFWWMKHHPTCFFLLNILFHSEICHITEAKWLQTAIHMDFKQHFSVPLTVLFWSMATRQIDREREREREREKEREGGNGSCWVMYQLKWSPELMTKNQKEGKSEWGESETVYTVCQFVPHSNLRAIWQH